MATMTKTARRRRSGFIVAGLATLLAACAQPPVGPATSAAGVQSASSIATGRIGGPVAAVSVSAADVEAIKAAPLIACPAKVPAGTRCYQGQDENGAFYWIAVPANWNQVLVLHAHGGPETGAPRPERTAEDLTRWAVVVKAGYAWAGSTYRRGGYGVTMAAEDTERLRQLFVARFGQPRRTVLHGQSYGGGVAAKQAELFATSSNGRSPYDALLLTSGVLGGGTRSYDFRLDLRAVYQSLCNNHPLPTEPAYPLWMGLPAASTLTRGELLTRMNTCLGIRTPAAQRTPAQQQRLDTLLKVVRIPERSLVGHMNWATWLFEDVTQQRLGGRNPFGNVGARYVGSPDDAALNAGVLRYAADPSAVADLARDSDPSGRVNIPTLTLHAVNDPTAFVELESQYREMRERAGTADLLVQNFADESEHSYLSDPEYVALLAGLLDWVDRGVKPTPQALAASCARQPAVYEGGCHWLPDYKPAPLDTRSTPRRR